MASLLFVRAPKPRGEEINGRPTTGGKELNMDEENTIETAEDQSGAFLEGWDGDEAAADQPAAEEPKAEPEATPETTGTEPKEPEAPAEGAASEPTWDVKYMDGQRTMSAKEITPELLQKGLDYDRVRDKYDASKPVMDMIRSFAEKAGMSIPDYTAYLRAKTKEAEGLSEEEAKRAIDLEDREAKVAAAEEAANREQAGKKAAEERIQAEVAEFRQAFPEIAERAAKDGSVIPKEVWDSVREGKSLTAAYARYAVAAAQGGTKAAEKKAEAAESGAKNAARSTGSMQSAGADAHQKDAFLEGWDS